MALPFSPCLQASQQLPQQAALPDDILAAPLKAASSRWWHLAPAERQHLPDGAPPQRPGQQQLRHSGYLASNKPHPAEKSTPVWLAIWRTWAGFANSQLLPDAAPLSSMQGLPRSGNSSAQTSASLHPPAALRLRCLQFTGDMGVLAGNSSAIAATWPATNLIRRRKALRFG